MRIGNIYLNKRLVRVLEVVGIICVIILMVVAIDKSYIYKANLKVIDINNKEVEVVRLDDINIETDYTYTFNLDEVDIEESILKVDIKVGSILKAKMHNMGEPSMENLKDDKIVEIIELKK